MKAGTMILVAALMMMPFVGGMTAQAQLQTPAPTLKATQRFWICEVVCGRVAHDQFNPSRSVKTGLVKLKDKKENDPILSKINLWPIGYRIKLDRAGSGNASASDYTYGCSGSGRTPQEAMKSLASRLTGKDLPIVAIPCRGCQNMHVESANCIDTQTQQSYPYSVLQSRMNPKPVLEAPTSSADSAR